MGRYESAAKESFVTRSRWSRIDSASTTFNRQEAPWNGYSDLFADGQPWNVRVDSLFWGPFDRCREHDARIRLFPIVRPVAVSPRSPPSARGPESGNRTRCRSSPHAPPVSG